TALSCHKPVTIWTAFPGLRNEQRKTFWPRLESKWKLTSRATPTWQVGLACALVINLRVVNGCRAEREKETLIYARLWFKRRGRHNEKELLLEQPIHSVGQTSGPQES